MTTTNHKAAALTAASALAMWDAAQSTADKVRAGAAMAEVLRAKAAPKAKAPKADDRTLSAKTLTATLQRMGAIAPKKSHIPIVGTVLLQSAGGKLTITATDLEMQYSETLDAPSLGEFEAAVSCVSLSGLVKGEIGEIGLEREEGDVLRVNLGGSSTTLATLPAQEFPHMIWPEGPPAAVGEIGVARWLETLGFVACSVSTEETRYYLNGVYLHATNKGGAHKLTFASSDGSRLTCESWSNLPLPLPAGEQGIILPRAAVAWMLKHLKGETMDIEVSGQRTKFRITTPHGRFASKLIDGSFPDYQRVIPRAGECAHVICVSDAEGAVSALTKSAKANGNRHSSVCIVGSGNKVEVSTWNSEGVNYTADMPQVACSTKFKTSLNPKLLAEILTAGAGPARIERSESEANPLLILWPGRPERAAVLMPLRS